jgi:hypothetical protein
MICDGSDISVWPWSCERGRSFRQQSNYIYGSINYICEDNNKNRDIQYGFRLVCEFQGWAWIDVRREAVHALCRLTYLNIKTVNLSLCLIKHHESKMDRGVEAWLHALLTSALNGGEWSAPRSGRLTPGQTEDEAGCVPDGWSGRGDEDNPCPLGKIEPPTSNLQSL